MQLLDNWKDVITKSWSVKILALGGIAELVLQLLSDGLPTWAIIGLLITAIGARAVAQKGMSLPEAGQ